MAPLKVVRPSHGPSHVVETDIHESVVVRSGAFRFDPSSLGKNDNVGKGSAPTESMGEGKGKYA